MKPEQPYSDRVDPISDARHSPLRHAALGGLVAGALLLAPANAQNLLGLDSPGPNPRVTELLSICAPSTDCSPPLGTIGPRYGLPSTPGGGLALDEVSGDRWLTPGDTLHRLSASCGSVDQWNGLGLLPPGAIPAHSAWTGLAYGSGPGKLFFTNHGHIAEVDAPAIGSGGPGVHLPASNLVFVNAPYPLAPPLTSVEYDPIDDTLWVLDSQYNVVQMGRPGSGVGVLNMHNVGAKFLLQFGNVAPWCEGLTLDPLAQPSGHPRGVLLIVDAHNRVLHMSTDGTVLGGCTLSGLTQIYGLANSSPSTVSVGVPYCFGDGTGTVPCPCGNTGAPGRGCANSTPSGGARLVGSGSASVAADDLVLIGSGARPGHPGLYFQGNNVINGGNGFHHGDGLRCAGGSTVRLQVVMAGSLGGPNPGGSQTSVDIAALGAVSPGDIRRYQLWYRDPNPGSPCGNGFNLSNALEVVWTP